MNEQVGYSLGAAMASRTIIPYVPPPPASADLTDEEMWVTIREGRYLVGRSQKELEVWTRSLTSGGRGLETRLRRHDGREEQVIYRPNLILMANRVDGSDRPSQANRPLDGHFAAAIFRLFGRWNNLAGFFAWAKPFEDDKVLTVWSASPDVPLQSDLYSLTELHKLLDSAPMVSVPASNPYALPPLPVPVAEPSVAAAELAPVAESVPEIVAAPAAQQAITSESKDAFIRFLLRAARRKTATLALEPDEVSLIIDALLVNEQMLRGHRLNIIVKAAKRAPGANITLEGDEVGVVIDALEFRVGSGG